MTDAISDAAPPAIRLATPEDAPAMCALINPIIARGGTTAHRDPFDAARMIHHYIAPPGNICCQTAWLGDDLAGFQALIRANPDWPPEHRLPEAWASIGSFVALGAQGRGIGHALFAATCVAARAAGITAIDATIRRENTGGRAFYRSLGFRLWREDGARVCKRFDLTAG